MPHQANLSPVPTPDEEAWTPQAERLYDRGEINADEARLRSGLPVGEPAEGAPRTVSDIAPRQAGRTAIEHAAPLELVTEDHQPLPGAKRAAKLRPQPAATTPAQKFARDMGESASRKTAFGHDPYPPIQGVK